LISEACSYRVYDTLPTACRADHTLVYTFVLGELATPLPARKYVTFLHQIRHLSSTRQNGRDDALCQYNELKVLMCFSLCRKKRYP